MALFFVKSYKKAINRFIDGYVPELRKSFRKVVINMASKHPGFKSVQSSIARKEGVSKGRAGAILAAATRRASPAAKKANPHLKRVKG